EPVYVHFYSPRWICRVGNYRSYEEAAHILKQVKGLGYKQASIVRGKITVQY
ncbi:MAG: SPOR domain-containing protein, partial [Prevotella buccalis]|nr:SPOR domain-containing protein [Hoylesella buccalis]